MKNEKREWYDDRVTLDFDVDEIADNEMADAEKTSDKAIVNIRKPQDIYNYLNQKVWKQDEAKKAAAILVNNVLEGRKQNMMFVGPSGCGKTHIFRCLQELYPDLIEIVDASNITQDGWKGDKKWNTLLASPIFAKNEHKILVLDEIDKLITPKTNSQGENMSHSVLSEALKIIEGTKIKVKEERATRSVDTSNISFVLCGAFSQKANCMAEDMSEHGIGFGATQKTVEAYSSKMTIQDIIDFGALPEFMGRIERVVNLEPMTKEDYCRILIECKEGPIQELEKAYNMSIHISEAKCEKLAQEAAKSGLGIRSIKSLVRLEIDNARFEDYYLKELSLD